LNRIHAFHVIRDEVKKKRLIVLKARLDLDR
jgi:hypothetical protein